MSIVYNTKPTISLREFIPRVQAAIDGVDVEMAAQYIADAAITFARSTRILRETICVELISCQDSYRLDTPYRIIEVVSVRRHEGDDCGFAGQYNPNLQAYVDDGVLYLDPMPTDANAGSVIEIEVAMVPSRNAVELPETLYEDWVEAVVQLALSQLYLLADTPWYSLGASREQHAWYKQSVISAKMANMTKHKPLNVRLSPRRIRGRR